MTIETQSSSMVGLAPRRRWVKLYALVVDCFTIEVCNNYNDLLKNYCEYVSMENMCYHELEIHGICIKVVLRENMSPTLLPFVMYPLPGRFDQFIHSEMQLCYRNKINI